jgi:hypothetical protein
VEQVQLCQLLWQVQSTDFTDDQVPQADQLADDSPWQLSAVAHTQDLQFAEIALVFQQSLHVHTIQEQLTDAVVGACSPPTCQVAAQPDP